MTRRGLQIVSAALTLLALDAAPAAADCLPAADLSGDADIAAEVARALAALGVGHGEVDGACPPVAATVLRDETGIAVTVRGSGGRIEGRVVADVATAAAWIESWAHDEAEPLWSAPVVAPAPTDEAPVAALEIAPPPETAIEVAVPARTRVRSRWLPSMTVRIGREYASDGSAWDGAGGAACVRLGPMCVGAVARHAANGSFTETGGLTVFDRTATVVAGTAAFRARVAHVELSPEIAIGAGRLATRRHEPAMQCVNADGTLCPGPLVIGDGASTTNIAARLGAGVGIAVPLARWLWLDARVGAELAPGARTAPFHPDAPASGGDPGGDPGCDPTTDPNGCSNTPPVPADDPLLDLPGEPAWSWGAALGLRVELP